MRSSLPALVTISFLLSGCFSWGDDLGAAVGEGGGCLAGDIALGLGSMFEESRLGEAEDARLVGLCNAFENCTAFAPIMRGSEIDVIASQSDGSAVQNEPSDMVSATPDVLSVQDVDGICSVLQGTLVAEAPGFATISVRTPDGATLDRFDLEVAEAASLSLAPPAEEEAALFEPGEHVILQATVRDIDDRLLTARGGVVWTVADDGVLLLDGDPPTGGVLIAERGIPGTTIVRASAGGIVAEIEITVE